MQTWHTSLFAAFLVGASTACGSGAPITSTEDHLGTLSEALVSYGANAVSAPNNDPLYRTTSGSTLVKTYNALTETIVALNTDYTGNGFTYTSSTETVCPNATKLGFRYSAGAPSMTNPYMNQVLVPPSNTPFSVQWPVFLGNPSVGQISGSPYYYLSTLAVPQVNMPKGGGCFTGNAATLSGGGCVLTYTFPSNNLIATQCLTNTGSTYDVWNATEVVGTANGTVYAAFQNQTQHEIDLFVASAPTANFVQLSNPFPGRTIIDAPRMVDYGKGVYLIAADNTLSVWLVICSTTDTSNGGCTAATQITPSFSYASSIGGPAYDVAVYGGDVRVVYNTWAPNNGSQILQVAECNRGACWPSNFTIDQGSLIRNPSISTAWAPVEQAIAWKVSWLTEVTGGWDVNSADLGANPGSVTQIRREAGSSRVCGPLNYNEHLGVYQPFVNVDPQFVYTFPDSTYGTSCTHWRYWSSPLFTSATYEAYP